MMSCWDENEMMIVVETLTPGHEFESASASRVLNHTPIDRNRTCCDKSLVFLMLDAQT